MSQHDGGHGAARVMVIVGNPKPASRTREVGERVGERIRSWLETRGAWSRVDIETLELADHAPSLLSWGDEKVAAAVTAAQEATVLVVASPTFKATYTGLLKTFLDQIPTKGLAGCLAVPVMMGAAPIHFLAVDAFLRPVLLELGASCPTPGLFVLESQMDDLDTVTETWLQEAQFGLGAALTA